MAFVLTGAIGAPAFAKTATVKGQVVDQECYLREKKVDTDKTCAVECAKSGKPMALLTSDGKVYEDRRRTGGEQERKTHRPRAAHRGDHW